MLELFEKIGFGFGGLCLLVTLTIYLFVKLPSTDSLEFIPRARRVGEPPKAAGTVSNPATPAAPSEEEQAIVQKLKEQDLKLIAGQRVQMETYEVNSALFEYANAEGNWMKELKKAQSDRIRTKTGETRLKVHTIAENSLLKSFGIQENDVVELIDGEIVSFSETTTHEIYARAKTLLNKLREGGTISVTVTRSNRPVHLKFNLPQ